MLIYCILKMGMDSTKWLAYIVVFNNKVTLTSRYCYCIYDTDEDTKVYREVHRPLLDQDTNSSYSFIL